MTAAKRRPPSGRTKPLVRAAERQAILHRDFRRDLTHWIGVDARTALRLMRLIEEVIRDPFTGLG